MAVKVGENVAVEPLVGKKPVFGEADQARDHPSVTMLWPEIELTVKLHGGPPLVQPPVI